MIVYPTHNVIDCGLEFRDSVDIIIFAEDIPVGVANLRLIELGLSPRVQNLLNLMEFEYVGECDQRLLQHPGFGLCTLREISNAIKKKITQFDAKQASIFLAHQ